MKLALVAMLIGAVIILAARAKAEDIDNAQAGYTYAQAYCAKCHGISGEPSPLPQAPRFKIVAEQPGITAMSLQVWLQTSHPTMPNIIVEPKDMKNVIAYILSLKGRE